MGSKKNKKQRSRSLLEIPERSGTTANAEAPEKCGETPESSNDVLSTKNIPGFNSYQEAAVTSDKRGRKRKLQDGQVKVVVVGGSCLPLTDILPFSAQHQVLIRLQKLLENMCLAFGLRWCAAAMREHRWTEPGSLELTSWIRYMQRHAHTLPTGALASTDPSIVKMILNSVASIRHHAVHRVAKGTRGLLECLENAKAFAELHRDQDAAEEITQYMEGCKGVCDELVTGQVQLRTTLHCRLEKIQAQAQSLADDATNELRHCSDRLLFQAGTNISAILSKCDQAHAGLTSNESLKPPADDTGFLFKVETETMADSSGMLLLPLQVDKVFTAQGSWQLHKLKACTEFTCFQCALMKNSHYVACDLAIPNRPICNACYGRLLSAVRQEMESPTADHYSAVL